LQDYQKWTELKLDIDLATARLNGNVIEGRWRELGSFRRRL
jgi:hypothetical protein